MTSKAASNPGTDRRNSRKQMVLPHKPSRSVLPGGPASRRALYPCGQSDLVWLENRNLPRHSTITAGEDAELQYPRA